MTNSTRLETESACQEVAQLVSPPTLSRLVRLLFCLAITVGAAYCLMFLQAMRAQTSPNQARELLSEQDSAVPLLPLMDSIHGNWQFAGVPWHVKSQELPPDVAYRMLSGPVARQDLSTSHATDDLAPEQAKHSDEVAELLHAIVGMLGASQTIESELCVYRLTRNDFAATAFAPQAQPQRIQLVRILQMLSDERANFVELRRENTDRVVNPTDGRGTLLPPHPDNLRLGIRYDEQGFLTAELIQLRTDFDRVQSLWRQAGWVLVEQTSVSSGPQDWALPQDTSVVLATHDDDVVLAIATRASPQLPPTLFLVHAPR